MAIEDSYALMLALRPGLGGAMRRYITMRHRRVREVQLTSRRLGSLSHWANPMARAARDAIMRSLPSPVADRHYARLVQPALDMLDTPSPTAG
jgi:2-polyprenyl-6-methoxyphenol hydroxylase-like FAD-dependent oxidoreductase